MQAPSLPNIFNAIGAAWNALPFNTNSYTMNPYMNTGAPNILPGTAQVGMLSTAQKLSNAAKVQNARSLAVRRANAEAKRAVEQAAKRQEHYDVSMHAAKVRDPYSNYVSNESERAAAVDYLNENPKMFGQISTEINPAYDDYVYTYPYTAQINRAIYPRKTFKETESGLRSALRNIKKLWR